MVQIFWLTLISALVWLVASSWSWLRWALLGAIVLSAAAWVFVSTFYPSSPDRTCPRCREAGLVKLRRGEPGVVCERCGFRDESLHVAYLDEW